MFFPFNLLLASFQAAPGKQPSPKRSKGADEDDEDDEEEDDEEEETGAQVRRGDDRFGNICAGPSLDMRQTGLMCVLFTGGSGGAGQPVGCRRGVPVVGVGQEGTLRPGVFLEASIPTTPHHITSSTPHILKCSFVCCISGAQSVAGVRQEGTGFRPQGVLLEVQFWCSSASCFSP